MKTVKVEIKAGQTVKVDGQQFLVIEQMKTVAPELNQSIWCVKKPKGKKHFMLVIKHNGIGLCGDRNENHVGEVELVA